MCGLAGEFVFQNQKPLPTNWDRISQLMIKRGPDQKGEFVQYPFHLVFRRLSILDLSDKAQQPMVDTSGRYVLCFNGELYNYIELKDQLISKGFSFRSTSDTEVVLNSLIFWGKEALQKFNGMFALAFTDLSARKMILSVDHCGIKPLYYHLQENTLFFASQLNQVIAYNPQFSIHHEAVVENAKFTFNPGPQTILKNTWMLLPGQYIEVRDDGTISKGFHYSFPQVSPKFSSSTYQENLEHLDSMLQDSLKQQCQADVPISTFLSSGVDSSLVNCYVNQKFGNSFKAISFGVEGDQRSEIPGAQKIAHELELQWIREEYTLGDLTGILAEVIESQAEPLSDVSLFPTFLVCSRARQYGKVMLGGDGGDELFFGYPERFNSVIQQATDFKINPWLRKLNHKLGYTKSSTSYYQTIGHWYQEKHSRISESYLKCLFPSVNQTFVSTYFDFSGTDPQTTAYWLKWNETVFHLRKVLLKVDRASMANSIEVRVPLLDKNIFEASLQFRYQDCLDAKKNLGKIPLRDCLKKHLSYENSKKMGFDLPLDQWLRSQFKDVVYEHLYSKKELFGVPIDQKTLHTLFEKFYTQHWPLESSLWSLLSLSLWEKIHIQGGSL